MTRHQYYLEALAKWNVFDAQVSPTQEEEDMRKKHLTFRITQRQLDLYEELEDIAEVFGKFDKSTGADGSHYIDAGKNPFIEEGLACVNCVFYEEEGMCEIVDGDIEPNALCKLWIIPESAIN